LQELQLVFSGPEQAVQLLLQSSHWVVEGFQYFPCVHVQLLHAKDKKVKYLRRGGFR